MLKNKLIIFIVGISVFSTVIIYIDPPNTWPEANIWQILLFFIPLLIAFASFFDFFFQYPPHSFIAGLGSITLIAFLGVNQLNPISFSIITTLTILFIKLLPKLPMPHIRLFHNPKIPKLKNH